ncbi:MAG: putative 2-aminoethylphosphonate ABC transporter permease subunit, partial [Candidatus Rokuibacteriota bacterium]
MRACMVLIGLYLVVTLAWPLWVLLSKSFQSRQGGFIGLANYAQYFATPALAYSIYNSFYVSILSTVITVPLAFVYAYALTRSCLPLRGLFKSIALVPILVPSLLPGIALVYLFGNQGMIRGLMFGQPIYGPIGIVMAEVFFTFPHALLIIVTALSLADARLYEAAVALRASRSRIFFTVTIPGARYGLISATFVVFTMVITDFGAPKVIGGQYNVLATDIYKQVIGQQNFEMGAVVGVVLLIPAVFAFAVDRLARRRQVALLSTRAVPYEPKPNRRFDLLMLAYCVVISALLLGVLAVSQYAALVTFYPYKLSLTLRHYNFTAISTSGWLPYFNSIRMALYIAALGTVIVFVGAYLVEKGRGFFAGRALYQLLAMIPMAVPGLVLGLAYIFFFNDPRNPLHGLYRTMAILVINTIVHFYTVA